MSASSSVTTLNRRNDLCDSCDGLLNDDRVWSSSIKAEKLRVPESHRTFCICCVLKHHAVDDIAAAGCELGSLEYLSLRGDSNTLQFEGSSCAIVRRDNVNKSIPNSVAFGNVKGWLARCDHDHDHSQQFELSERQLLIKLDLILIDVNKLCLVSVPHKGEYAALSYKWGDLGDKRQPRLLKGNIDSLRQPGALSKSDSCEKTIKDAMEICRQVDVDYLWVDALCIIQDSDQKPLQMQNMDAIYASASFTIVPAYSKSARDGIHGVSIERRRVHRYEYDKFWFVYGYNSVVNQVAESPWAERSWTYQEATLSRRLLVFTEELCCLICPKEICREDGRLEPLGDPTEFEPIVMLQYEPTFSSAIVNPLKGFSRWEKVFDEYQSWVSKSLQDGTLKSSPLELYAKILSSYLRRDLTKPEDIIRAFAGIVAELKPRMGNFWFGLPRIHLLEALTWQYGEHLPLPREYLSSGKRFYPTGRREGLFPSWSWSGWKHKLGAHIRLTSCAFESTKTDPDGKTVPPQIPPKMVAVYANSKDSLMRLNRSDRSQPELFDSELTETDKMYVKSRLSKLSVPLDTLLIFKTIMIHVDVAKYGFREEGGWAMFSITGEQDELCLRKGGGLTVVHLNVAWRKTEGDRLKFAILGIFLQTESPSMRVIALVVRQDENGIYFREGLAEMNIDPGVMLDGYIAEISKAGSHELICVG